MNFRREFSLFKQFMENDLNQGLEYLNLHQKWPHDGPDDGPDEVHGLIETDEALGGVFVRLAERAMKILYLVYTQYFL